MRSVRSPVGTAGGRREEETVVQQARDQKHFAQSQRRSHESLNTNNQLQQSLMYLKTQIGLSQLSLNYSGPEFVEFNLSFFRYLSFIVPLDKTGFQVDVTV